MLKKPIMQCNINNNLIFLNISTQFGDTNDSQGACHLKT